MTPRREGRRGPVLRDYQSFIALALFHEIRRRPGETFTVLLPRQSGKNEISAMLVRTLLHYHARRGGSIVLGAPTFTPQGLISLDRTRRALEQLHPLVARMGRTEVDGTALSHGRARALFLSASPAAHVAGHTASIALIADEAQEIDQEWFERQFRPMAASTGAPAVYFGTPWDGTTLLDEAVARNRDLDAAAGTSSQNHFQVSWEEVAKAVKVYGRWVESERERLGPRSLIFRTQYGLETVDSSGRLLSAEALAAMEGAHPRLPGPLAGERYVAGLDVAGEGERADRSVLTIARVPGGGACEVVEHVAWRGAPLAKFKAEVIRAGERWRFERLVVDATGMGFGIAKDLALGLPWMDVEALAVSQAVKSELGYDLMNAAADGRVRLYANDGSPEAVTCRAELRACTKRATAAEKLWWGNRRGHDDYVFSLALGLRAARQVGEPRVATGRRRG